MGPRAENQTIPMMDSERNEINRSPPPRDPLADVDMDWRSNRQEMLVQWAQEAEARRRRHEQLRRERRDKCLKVYYREIPKDSRSSIHFFPIIVRPFLSWCRRV